ncbi:MAG: hypothetical protein H0Z24_05580 [Thermosipho sp. (in: Bacteria)]|nr:hypothetical protein [Thermosipho sp. (in: thermotogales)]
MSLDRLREVSPSFLKTLITNPLNKIYIYISEHQKESRVECVNLKNHMKHSKVSRYFVENNNIFVVIINEKDFIELNKEYSLDKRINVIIRRKLNEAEKGKRE